MPDSRDPEQYKERARAWRDRAASLPDGTPERDACVTIAEGYEKLAALIEARRSWCHGAGRVRRIVLMQQLPRKPIQANCPRSTSLPTGNLAAPVRWGGFFMGWWWKECPRLIPDVVEGNLEIG
jgi:hypothetical protein